MGGKRCFVRFPHRRFGVCSVSMREFSPYSVLDRRWCGGLLVLLLVFATAQHAFAEGRTPRYLVQAIEIEGNSKTQRYVIDRELLVRPGMELSVDDPLFELSRFQVLALGFFSDVQLRFKRGSRRGQVILVVMVRERGTIVLTDIFFGSSEATDAWGGFGLVEKNFLGRGISLEGAFVIGADPEVERGTLQQAYLLHFIIPRLFGSSVEINASFNFLDGSDFFRRKGLESNSDPADFLSIRYRRIGGALGVGFAIHRFARLLVDYRLEGVRAELPIGAVNYQPNGQAVPIDFGIPNGDSWLTTLAITLLRDTRSDPVVPSAGSMVSVKAELATKLLGGHYEYLKLSANYRHYFPLSWGHIFSTQVAGGVIFGDPPFFERFFVGDFNDLLPSRALGLNFSTRPSHDIFGTSIDSKRYEEFALRTSVEYIIPWFRGGKWAYSGDFFLNVGIIFMTSRDELRYRDRSLAESIPVDLTVDAGLRLDTRIGIFRLSIGNALGRIRF